MGGKTVFFDILMAQKRFLCQSESSDWPGIHLLLVTAVGSS